MRNNNNNPTIIIICSEENWPLLLKLHLKWRCEHLKEKWNPLSGDSEYKDLDNYSRISIIHKLCHWRLELDDIADLLRVSALPQRRGCNFQVHGVWTINF